MSKAFHMSDIDVENFTQEIMALRRAANAVSYTHLTLPTSDLV